MKLKLRGKDLREIGYPESPAISIAINVMEQHHKRATVEEALGILKGVLERPEEFVRDPVLGKIAKALQEKKAREEKEILLKETKVDYNVFGAAYIEQGAIDQMNSAARLPITVAGALMPDAHHGYGLPIGGVLATENAVIPYGVGVDIGCRMCLSIFEISPDELDKREQYFSRELNEATLFGSGAMFINAANHEIMERPEFQETELLRSL